MDKSKSSNPEIVEVVTDKQLDGEIKLEHLTEQGRMHKRKTGRGKEYWENPFAVDQ